MRPVKPLDSRRKRTGSRAKHSGASTITPTTAPPAHQVRFSSAIHRTQSKGRHESKPHEEPREDFTSSGLRLTGAAVGAPAKPRRTAKKKDVLRRDPNLEEPVPSRPSHGTSSVVARERSTSDSPSLSQGMDNSGSRLLSPTSSSALSALHPLPAPVSAEKPETVTAPVDLTRGNNMRLQRLLRDARAAAGNPFRPETPTLYNTQSQFSSFKTRSPSFHRKPALGPMRGVRLTPLKVIQAHNGVEVEASKLVSSVTQLDPETFLSNFMTAEGDVPRQSALLRQLMCWLANPSNRIWPEAYDYFMYVLRRVHQSRLAYQAALWEYGSSNLSGRFSSVGTRGREGPPPATLGVPAPEDPSVSMIIISVLLHNSPDMLCDPYSLMDMVALLRSLAEEGLANWLERELIFDPLLNLITDERTPEHPELLSNVLAIVQECTTSLSVRIPSRKHRQSSAEEELKEIQAREEADAAAAAAAAETTALTSQLVTLGVIPKVTSVARVLLTMAEEKLKDQAKREQLEAAGEDPVVPGADEEEDDRYINLDWIEEMMERICLIYRNLSVTFAHHLLKLGTLDIITLSLYILKHSRSVVEAAARAVAKLVFDDECLAALADNVNFIRAALQALMAQLHLPVGGNSSHQNSEDHHELEMLLEDDPRSHLLVARLAGTMARVAEQNEDQRDLLALHGTTLSLILLKRYVHVDAFSLDTSAPFSIAGRSPVKQAKKRKAHQPAEDGEPMREASVSSLTGRWSQGGHLPDDEDEELEEQSEPRMEPGTDLPLVQSIVWLVGVIAMSPYCSLEVVLEGVPLLTRLLQDVELTPMTRPTVLYTLMALSNLSFFFGTIEERDHLETEDSEGDSLNPRTSATSSSRREKLDTQRLLQLYEPLGLTVAGVMVAGDVEATVEATRILSNICYTVVGADWVEVNQCDDFLVLFLGHEDLRIVYNSTGALLNLTAGTSCRVVEDPRLLSMMLQYTSRFTSKEALDQAAMEEKKVLLHERQQWRAIAERRRQQQQQQMGGSSSPSMAFPPRLLTEAEASLEAEQVAGSYAEQIAEVVERLLHNIRGLLAHKQEVELAEGSGETKGNAELLLEEDFKIAAQGTKSEEMETKETEKEGDFI